MKKTSIIMAVLACAIIAAAYTNSVPISTNTRAATEKWTAIRFEPALPPTPENAASKFLNGNREWQTVAAEQDPVANAALAVHTNRTDNPHGVTAAQIGAITNELDLVALAADRFLPIDAGKNVISTDAGSGSIVTYSTLIGDRAGNSITGANVVAIGRDAARDILNPGVITPETDLSTIAIGENAAEQAGGMWVFSHNIAIGSSAFKEGAGQSSIAIGQDALDKTPGAFTTIAIGREAGRTAAAEHMIAIGYQAGEQAGLTNSVVIGANAGRRASGQNILVIDSSGNDDSSYPARAMIYGNANDLTLGRIDSDNSLRGNWLLNNNRILTNEQDLAALRTYHYGSPDIVESPAEWFVFDGAGTITAFNWSAGRENVVIPWEIGGVPVTAIGVRAFQNLVTYQGHPVVSVVAPQTVTAIGSSAFDNCRSLTSVIAPQAQTIGEDAFAYCTALASIDLPQATAIGDYAFYSCDLLASVSLPQATTIGDYAFAYCNALTSVHMGQNAPTEAEDVFYGITRPPTVYVTNPQATGWGDTWNGAPVVRPPLYADAIYQAGELVATTGHVAQAIAAIPEPDLPDRPTFAQIAASNALPYTAWTGTITPANGTATVAIAHGNMPVLVTSAPCVLTLDPTGYGTAGVSRVSLSYYTGTNSFTFATNVITYSATPNVDTNGWNTLLIRRVSDGAWKGVGL